MTRDHAVTGNDVPVHAEIAAPVFNEGVDFLETALVEEDFKPLAGGHLPPGMLGFDACLPAACFDACLPGAQVFQALLGSRHGCTYLAPSVSGLYPLRARWPSIPRASPVG